MDDWFFACLPGALQSWRRTKNPPRVIEAGFLSIGTRCTARRQDSGRLISQTTDNFAARRGWMQRSWPATVQDNFSKKRLVIGGDFLHTSRSCGDERSS
jgi:hypothetical protein